jgi:hypothetical protein
MEEFCPHRGETASDPQAFDRPDLFKAASRM